MTTPIFPADAVRWVALPQPSTIALRRGRWRPRAVRVIADDPAFAAEAVRFEQELAAGGMAIGDGSAIRIRSGEGTGSPETFAIDIRDDIEITADAPVGAFRATRQLLHNLRAQGFVPHGVVQSSPAVPERGLHLDAARKHFPAPWLSRLLHELANVGINTLQWHVSENEGFRIGSDAFPEIVSAEHITRDDVRAIADLAADLHIDLIPSLDMPGHLEYVLAQNPEFRMPSGGPLSERALDITRPDAVQFALALIDDVAPLFPHSTSWHLGGDEFVDFARINEYPTLLPAARERFGPTASGFDLLTGFVNDVSAHLRERGFRPRVWNDGMLRGAATSLDSDTVLTWWTNWHQQMRPLQAALDAGHDLVDFNDGLFYYVLGEKAGYTYPTARQIWDADWHPGLFSALPGAIRQEILPPYPHQLRGASFSIWCDDPDAQSSAEVLEGIRHPLRAMTERAWNGGSALTLAELADIDDRVGTAVDTICFP